jgi:hypothetical protein
LSSEPTATWRPSGLNLNIDEKGVAFTEVKMMQLAEWIGGFIRTTLGSHAGVVSWNMVRSFFHSNAHFAFLTLYPEPLAYDPVS